MCRIVCLILGAVAAALAWYFLQGLVSTFPLLLISAFTFIATAWMLYEGFCGAETSTSAKVAAASSVAAATAASAKMGKTDRDYWSPDDAGASSAATATPANFVAASTEAKPAAKKPAAKKAAPKKAAAKTKAAPAKPAAAKAAAAPKAKAAAAPKAKAAAKKAPAKKAGPERLKKPKGKADDLKLIAGVGPKLEKTLNGLGFWHFEQIAKWKKADVAIVDDELSFKGRIERDDWIKQAKALAKGGEAEYIKVFGKKPR